MSIARTDNSTLGRWWWTVDRWTLAALVVLAGLGLMLTVTASPPVAERIAGEWLLANAKVPARPGKGPAWTVGNTGTRLVNWLVHAPLLLGGEAGGSRIAQ